MNILLKNLFRAMGFRPTADELAILIEEIDEDGSGAIEFGEFAQLCAKFLVEVDDFIFYMSSVFSLVSPVISEFLENQRNPFEPSAARHFPFLQMNRSPLSDMLFSIVFFAVSSLVSPQLFNSVPHKVEESKVIVSLSPFNMLEIVKKD